MIHFVFYTSILSTVVLFCSALANSFDSYLLRDWSNLIGWSGIVIVLFAILGATIKKVLEEIAPAVFGKLPFLKKITELSKQERLNEGRRRFLHISINAGMILSSGSLTACGMSEALDIPRVKTTDIKITGLQPDLDGFRIIQITDLHITSSVRRNWLQKLVERINLQKPDIIVSTGDILDDVIALISKDIEQLALLKAKIGKYSVSGNHEYFIGVNESTKEMKKAGFTVLSNDHRIIRQGRGRILLGGVEDYSAPSRSSNISSPTKAMGNSSQADVKILLAHQPNSVYKGASAGFDLQLSGHTHGGQFALGRWLVGLVQPYQSGLYRYNDTQLYVSNGAGYIGPPLRIGAPSEISLLRLSKA